MPYLDIEFEGMALFVSSGKEKRSEALFIDTNKVETQHSHIHVVKLDPYDLIIEEALLWVEQNGQRLTGAISEKRPKELASLDDLCPQEPLAEALRTNDPENDPRWTDTLTAWLRLPGDEMSAAETRTPGGRSEWTFPRSCDQPAKSRQLTQSVTLRRPLSEEIKTLELAIRRIARWDDDPLRLRIPRVGDEFKMRVVTKFVGKEPPRPQPKSCVKLVEMQLLYECLECGHGPIPRTIWPNLSPEEREGSAAVHPDTDPATGICPPAIKDI
jgi:hypothetical protein